MYDNIKRYMGQSCKYKEIQRTWMELYTEYVWKCEQTYREYVWKCKQTYREYVWKYRET